MKGFHLALMTLAACAPPLAPIRAPLGISLPAPAAAIPATPTMPKTVDESLVGGLLTSDALKPILAAPEKFRFQVLYGVIENGTLVRHGYREDAEYFYPASSMKVPIALALYDRLAVQRAAGKPALVRDAQMKMTPATGEPFVTTLAQETSRALIVSDNASANRLLAFVGHREANETLWALGLASARIHDGFAGSGPLDPAEVSPKIDMTANGHTDALAARKSDLKLPKTDAKRLAVGQSVLVDGKVVPGPMSFAEKNAMRLADLQEALVRIMRPELLPASKADETAKEDNEYLQRTLGTLPSESGLAGYQRNVVADYQLSPFLRGIERVRPRGHFQIFSKVGQAYGFLIGNAYVVDKDSGRAFFLIASIYANPSETLNSDNYAYDTIAFPALADVAEAIAKHAFAAPR